MIKVMVDKAIQPILSLCAGAGLVALQELKDILDAYSASVDDVIARY